MLSLYFLIWLYDLLEFLNKISQGIVYSLFLLKSKCEYFISHTFLLFKYSCLDFPHHHSSRPLPSPLPTLDSNPLWSICPLYMFLNTLPHFHLCSHPTSPPVTVSLFLILMTLVMFCLLVSFVD